MKKYSLYIMLLIVLSCSKEVENKAANNAIPINYDTVKEINVSKKIIKSGIVSQKKQLSLSFKIGGYVDKIYVNEGQAVKKGQLIAKLNLTEIESHLNQAKLSLKKLSRDNQRIKNLFKDSVTTFQQLQDSETAYQLAKNQVRIAEYNFKNAKIVAPNNGSILKKLAEEDQLIAPGQPILFFSDNSSKTIIKVGLSDKEFVSIKLGDKAFIKFDFYDVQFLATISELAATANQSNGLFDVTLTIEPQIKHSLITGMIGRVEFNVQKDQLMTVIPINAISSANRNQAVVYVYNSENNKVEQRKIEINGMNESYIIVKSGLMIGEKIVTEGVLYLYDNADVTTHNSTKLFTENE